MGSLLYQARLGLCSLNQTVYTDPHCPGPCLFCYMFATTGRERDGEKAKDDMMPLLFLTSDFALRYMLNQQKGDDDHAGYQGIFK